MILYVSIVTARGKGSADCRKTNFQAALLRDILQRC